MTGPSSAPSRDFSSPVAGILERLVGIPSVTGAEEPVVEWVEARLSAAGWTCESIPVSPGRRNLFAHRGRPRVVLSTHADTVPPHFPPRREGSLLFARGACDAKGSLAAMLGALESLAGEGEAAAALLLVVGEERGSDGALAANAYPRANESEFLVGGEPTDNEFVAGSKGCVRIAVETEGRAGHSSRTSAEGARSAVPPLLDILAEIRALAFRQDPVFGDTTANIGVLQAGTAPNVVAERGRAEVLFRTGVPVDEVLAGVRSAIRERGALSIPYRSEPVRFRVPRSAFRATEEGGSRGIVSFACDLPLLDRWGAPILVGPGSIAHAHAADERVDLEEVRRAAGIYRDLVQGLLARGEAYLAPAPGGA